MQFLSRVELVCGVHGLRQQCVKFGPNESLCTNELYESVYGHPMGLDKYRLYETG
jgi:hypothetical protein